MKDHLRVIPKGRKDLPSVPLAATSLSSTTHERAIETEKGMLEKGKKEGMNGDCLTARELKRGWNGRSQRHATSR